MRESCISHRPRQPIAVVRQDYYELVGKDCVAAALLNVFEFWANAAIAANPDEALPWLGERRIKEFEELLIGISTDKQIRARLKVLRQWGFIETRQKHASGQALEYRLRIDRVQSALNTINAQASDPTPVKQPPPPRSSDRTTPVKQPQSPGQTTDPTPVKQPFLYIQEGSKEEGDLFLEDFGNKSEQAIEVEVETQQPDRDTSSPAVDVQTVSISLAPKVTGEDQLSAAPPAENWREFLLVNRRPPWRQADGHFDPLIVDAIHATGGSPGRRNIYDLPNGQKNFVTLKVMLRKLDTAATYSGYSSACPSTQKLSDLWELAMALKTSPATPIASPADLKALATYQSYADALGA